MSEKIRITTELDLEGAIIGFMVAIEPVNATMLEQIRFCKKLAQAFIARGVEFDYTFNLEKKSITLSAVKKENEPRVTIFHERSIDDPRCFWFIGEKQVDHVFDLIQIRNSDKWVLETILAWEKTAHR